MLYVCACGSGGCSRRAMRRGQRKQQGKGGLQFLTPILSINSLLKDLLKLQKSAQKPNRRHNRNHRGANNQRHLHQQPQQQHHHLALPTTSGAATALGGGGGGSSSSSSGSNSGSNNIIDCTANGGLTLMDVGSASCAGGLGDMFCTEMDNTSNMNPSNQVTSQTEPDPDSIKMFVGQIPRNMDENDLRKMFEDYGPVYSLNVLRDKNTGQSKGCCFVTFFTRKAALDAQNALHNIKTMPMMHHPIQMKPADSEKRNGESNVEDRKLFVGMLSKKLNENDVRMLFAPFGTIEDCTVLRDANSTSRGCAFITFATKQCAVNAIKGMHHSQTMEGCSSPLVVKMADTQKEKEQKKMQQMTSNLWMQFSNLGALGPQYLALLQQAASGNMGGNTGGNFGGNMGNLGRLLTALAGLNSGNANALGNNTGNSASGFGSNSNTAGDSSALQNLQGLAALANLANNPAAMNALGGQNMPFNSGASNNASQQSGGSGMGGMGGMGNMGNMGGMGGMGNMGNMGSMGNMGNNMGSNMGSGFGSNMNGFGSNNSGMDALSQAYSGIQQYAASFPNAFNPQAQMQQANSAAAKQSEGTRVPGPDGANLFIYHLPQEFGDQDLMQMFMPFGTVISAKVFIDKQTNLSKCFGFVSYDSPMAAQAAITSMNGFQIGMKRLKVQLKRPKNDKPY